VRVVVLRKADAGTECGTPNAELIAAIEQYDREMRDAGVLIGVERLQPSATGVRLSVAGSSFRTMDGPFAESKELIAGVNILEVESIEEAIEWMRRCPTLAGKDAAAEFEIRPVLETSPAR
jgi:hypothetical protein